VAWGRVRWLFAAIWLVYLAQPVSSWSANLAHRYLGLADRSRFGVFVVTSPPPLSRSQPNHCRQLSVAAVAAEAIFVFFAYFLLGPSAGSRVIHVGVMAVVMLPTRTGWAVVAACIAASLIVPSLVHGWAVDGTMVFQIFVSAVAAWGVGQVIQRNAQLVAARNEITRLALADQRNERSAATCTTSSATRPPWCVRAELAGTAGQPDPQRAETEIADGGADRPPPGAGRRPGPPRPGTGRSPWPGAWPAPDRAGCGRHRGGTP
jgi:two-component system sensor histidine kinase DesK